MFFPKFLDITEQRTLLHAALHKLDALDVCVCVVSYINV